MGLEGVVNLLSAYDNKNVYAQCTIACMHKPDCPPVVFSMKIHGKVHFLICTCYLTKYVYRLYHLAVKMDLDGIRYLCRVILQVRLLHTIREIGLMIFIYFLVETYAEMTPDEKNTNSDRRGALDMFRSYLISLKSVL